MILTAPDGSGLFLFDITPGAKTFGANVYIALRNYPDDTVYTVLRGSKEVRIMALQPVKQGLWAYPGDEDAFKRLEQPALFSIVEVVDAAPSETRETR